jgi:hypothetical protein
LCKRHYYLWYNHGGKEQTALLQASGSPTRICTKCRRELPVEAFSFRDRRGTMVPISRCRDCATDYSRDWRSNNRRRVNSRARDYRQRHPDRIARIALRRSATRAGLNKDDIEAYYGNHGGLCDICGKPPADKRLAVDHDHATGAFRGLICRKCNSAIGYFDDNPDLLRAAVRYFERDVGGLVRVLVGPVSRRPARGASSRAVFPDGPCHGCGTMMQRRGSNHKWCEACALKRRRDVRRAGRTERPEVAALLLF